MGRHAAPTALHLLPAESRGVIDKALREMIIILARRQAWEDHLKAMQPRTD